MEVYCMNDILTTLNHFIYKASDIELPFFKNPHVNEKFE